MIIEEEKRLVRSLIWAAILPEFRVLSTLISHGSSWLALRSVDFLERESIVVWFLTLTLTQGSKQPVPRLGTPLAGSGRVPGSTCLRTVLPSEFP